MLKQFQLDNEATQTIEGLHGSQTAQICVGGLKMNEITNQRVLSPSCIQPVLGGIV